MEAQYLVDEFLRSFPEYENTPCHILTSDYNWDDGSLEFCSAELDEASGHIPIRVIISLRKLISDIREIPEPERG